LCCIYVSFGKPLILLFVYFFLLLIPVLFTRIYVYISSQFVQIIHSNEKNERKKNRYPTKSLNPSSFKTFIIEKSLPLVGEMTSTNAVMYENILKSPVLTVFTAVDHIKSAKQYAYIMNRLYKVDKEVKSKFPKMKLIYAIADKSDFTHDCDENYRFNSDDHNKENIYYGIRLNNKYYKMTNKFTINNVVDFIDRFSRGEVEGNEKVLHCDNALLIVNELLDE